jgi:serine/threonine protein phosphatase 1
MVEGQTSLKTRNFWLANGGDATQASFGGNIPAEILHWTNHLPQIHIDRNRIFVHAGVDRDLPLDAQTAGTLLWRRPQPEDDHGAFWGRHLCHGHTPGNDNPRTTGSRTNVDSGCVFGKDNVLAAAVFDDDIAGPPLSFIKIANRG